MWNKRQGEGMELTTENTEEKEEWNRHFLTITFQVISWIIACAKLLFLVNHSPCPPCSPWLNLKIAL